jgi:mxaJ protein
MFALVLTLSATGVLQAEPPKADGLRRVLRVCADPNNLPFSNNRQEGFENKIASLLARDLGATLEYTWWAQRRGYVRNTINAGLCDLWIGVPTRLDMVLATRPYYRSTYALVQRKRDARTLHSFEAPEFQKLRIGVQIVGDDYSNSPPAHALAQRGITRNVRGYSVIGNYNDPNPPARIVEAVAKHEIDVAIAWGPLAGYFAAKQKVPLAVTPMGSGFDTPFLPLAFNISMGVKRGNQELKTELDRWMERRQPEIQRILASYGVPQLPIGAPKGKPER